MALGAISLIFLLFDDDTLPSTVILLVSGVVLIGVSLVDYAFGQIVDDIHAIRQAQSVTNTSQPVVKHNSNLDFRTVHQSNDILKNAAAKTTQTAVKRCPYCGDVVKAGRCEMCGKEVK